MGLFNFWKANDVVKSDQDVLPMPLEIPPPTTRKIIYSSTFINNKTDKEYNYVSENDFGLYYEWDNKVSRFTIYQKNGDGAMDRNIIAVIFGFSNVKASYKTISLHQEKEEQEHPDLNNVMS